VQCWPYEKCLEPLVSGLLRTSKWLKNVGEE
jgi:hypothetical protein